MRTSLIDIRTIAIATLTGAGLLSSGACGAAGTDVSAASPGSPPPAHVEKISSSQEIHLPLVSYLPSSADQAAYFAAVQIEQKRCAARFGVTDTMVLGPQPTQAEDATVRRYGLINAGEVARYGYRVPPEPGSSATDDKASGWNPSERERLVMNGSQADGTPVSTDPVTRKELPDHGCASEGFRVIQGSEGSPVENGLVGRLLNQAWKRTMADPRALAAAAKWAACMKTHGYDFKHRWDAGNSVGSASQEKQITMAKLDLGCAVQTDYNGVWYAADTAYQRELIAQHEGELQAILDDRRTVMARVDKVLEDR